MLILSTFSVPVALPDVTLMAGAYEFEVADGDSGDVVQVRNSETRQLAFLGFTHRVERPGAGTGRNVNLGEARPGQAPRSSPGSRLANEERKGYEFAYSGTG